MNFLLTNSNSIIKNIEYYVEHRDALESVFDEIKNENYFILNEILDIQKTKNNNCYAFYLSQDENNIFIIRITNNFKIQLLEIIPSNNLIIDDKSINSLKIVNELTSFNETSFFEFQLFLLNIRYNLLNYGILFD